ncbi:hypothetical protein N9B97_01880 [Porticoccaceae bacterium]|nr:hypothetical protein [Porticoccaceae bacterium]
MSRRRRRQKTSNLLPVAIIVSVLVIFGIFIFQYAKAVQSKIETDAVTNCRIDGFFPRDTVVLIDATEAVTDAQLEGLWNELALVIRDSAIHERFTVYFLKDEPERFQPKLIVCNPGTGKNLSPATNNLRKLMATWEDSFQSPLKDTLNGLLQVKPSMSSPIMEMLKFVGLRTFSRSESPDRRLILISDMVEHTDFYSQYRDRNLDFKSLSQRPHFKEMKPRLRGVVVDLWYIERSRLSDIQGSSHVDNFWVPFIRKSGGQIIQPITIIN